MLFRSVFCRRAVGIDCCRFRAVCRHGFGFAGLYAVVDIVFFIPFILVQFLILSGGKDESDKQVDYIIILGGRVYGEKPSRSLNERIITATKYLKEHKNMKVVASGGTGKGEEISEAEAIKRELIKNGIDETRIIKEDKSKNTIENLKFSLEKINENKIGRAHV